MFRKKNTLLHPTDLTDRAVPSMGDAAGHALFERIEELNAIGSSLSAERNSQRLLEKILLGAKRITNADGGTLYLLENESLRFEIMRNDSLNLAKGGTTSEKITLAPIALYDEHGEPNMKSVASFAALTGHTVNIEDAYTTDAGFDFAGTKRYDRETGYHSQSFLTIPMKNHENETIGVLQLINCIDKTTGKTQSFSEADQRLAESLASQAAVALTNHHLISELRRLMETFIEVIAGAIDEKSRYTGDHCRRVPELAIMLADALNEVANGPLAALKFDDQQMYEIKIAALLHDCGKITTPVHIVDKSTKLETIYDRIQVVENRFELLRREKEIEMLRKLSQCDAEQSKILQSEFEALSKELQDELAFLKRINVGSEFMPPEAQERVRRIAKRRWKDSAGVEQAMLTDEEVTNLTIAKGTLTPEQRKLINNHIVVTQRMLEQLPFPKSLRNVPEIAGNHHERMDGKGYPKGLKREEMSVQARLMGIADVFEALTASDRPYKKPMPLSQVLTIMGKMKQDGHIDPDIFDVFVDQKVYLRYGERFLSAEQRDEIDFNKVPGYNPLSGKL